MSNLRDIRRRIRSVENIKKITDAMERVAAARLRRAQTKAHESIPYVTKMKETLENLSTTEYSHPLFAERKVKRVALIVVSADKGLSGPYNTHILNNAERFLKKYDRDNVDLILFGKKAYEHFKSKQWNIEKHIIGWGGKITFQEITQISHELIEGFLTEKYDEVWLLYTHYVNVLVNEIKLEKFLNLGKPKNTAPQKSINYIFEPDPLSIYSEILPRYSSTKLQSALHDAYAAELASRIVAMQTASKNSENMITDLTLKRNKIRQEGITKEIIELSVSSE